MEKFEIQRLHADRGALENALKQAGAEFKGKLIKCLWHDDEHPSGGIYQNDKGEWRFKCQACGALKDVLDVQAYRHGKSVDELLRESNEPAESAPPPRVFATIEAMIESASKMWTVEDHYRYTNPTTRLVEMVVIRCLDSAGKKNFIQARPERGGYVQKAPPKPWPIFNRTSVAASKIVILVEGEKCVKALRECGWTATTSPGGALNGDKADWTPLAGKIVVLWRDFDDNGAKYMGMVTEALQKLSPAPDIRIIDVPSLELPEKGDCVDYIAKYSEYPDDREYNHNLIASVVDGAMGTGPSAKVRKLIADTVSGKRYAAALPWPGLDNVTSMLLPGTATAVCGDPAASKSFWLLQAARYWHELDVPFALYQLEADEDGSHLMRAVVQRANRIEMLDWKWLRDNPELAHKVEDENRDFIDSFGNSIWHPPSAIPSLAELTDWVRDRAKEGRRVIAIDPITAADTTKDSWNDDRKFVLNCQSITRAAGASMIIVTHPKLSAKSGTMAEMGGGSAYSRFTQTVLWIKAFYPHKEVTIQSRLGGTEQATVNRIVKVSKARLGRGTSMEIAYRFGGSMNFEEVGVMEKKQQKTHEDDVP